MTATTRSADDESPHTISADVGAPEGGGSLLQTGVAATQCDACGAAMAPDQRYCVECGTRRGKPRFELQPAGDQETVLARPAGAHRPSTRIVIAGIATVLLALGVGFLIGKSVTKASPVHVVVTNSGGSSGAATSAPSSSSGAGGTSSGSSGSSGSTANGGGSSSKSSSGTSTTPSNGNFFGGSGGG
jgi:hypothetical protein